MDKTTIKPLETEAEEKAKTRAKLYCSTVSFESIRTMVDEMPYELHADIAVIFYLQENRNGTTVFTPVTHAVAKELGMKCHEIKTNAWKNTVSEKQAIMVPLAEMLGEKEEKEMPDLYVLSNEEMFLGAVTMFYPGLLAVISKELGGDLCILPSSIHECLLMPIKNNTDIGSLRKIVKKVNDTEVNEHEILSYNVYRFSCRTGRVEIDNL